MYGYTPIVRFSHHGHFWVWVYAARLFATGLDGLIVNPSSGILEFIWEFITSQKDIQICKPHPVFAMPHYTIMLGIIFKVPYKVISKIKDLRMYLHTHQCSRFGSYGLMEFGTFSNQQLRIMDIFELAYTTRLFATVFKWHIVHLKPRIFSVYKKVNNFVKKKHTTLETTSSTPQHHYVISLQCLIHIYLHSGLAAKGAQLEFPPPPAWAPQIPIMLLFHTQSVFFIPCAFYRGRTSCPIHTNGAAAGPAYTPAKMLKREGLLWNFV